MSTTILERPVAMQAPATIGFGNLMLSEWTKLRTVRSTYWTGIVAVLATFGLAIGLCLRWRHDLTVHPGDKIGFDAALTSLTGLYLAQVAVGALGVLVISSEYGTGMIRATLGAVPQRRAVLAAKAIVFGGATLVIGEIVSFAAFGIGQAILAPSGAGVSLSDPHVFRAVAGGGLYLTAVGLLGFGLGALIRHTAGALSALFGLLFATTAIVDLLPTSLRNDVIKFMPLNAISQIVTTVPNADSLSAWAGFGVFCAYAAAAIGAATVLITRRDA